LKEKFILSYEIHSTKGTAVCKGIENNKVLVQGVGSVFSAAIARDNNFKADSYLAGREEKEEAKERERVNKIII
jgi:hypothetical protein